MEIKEVQNTAYTTLAPVGDLDANSSIEMDERIRQAIDGGQVNLHVDCSELQYISSAGLGVFISFMDELDSRGGGFVFSEMSDSVFKVFELLGLHQVMKIVEKREAVDQTFGKKNDGSV